MLFSALIRWIALSLVWVLLPISGRASLPGLSFPIQQQPDTVEWPAQKKLAAGPVIGHTTDNSVRYWMLVSRTDSIQIQLRVSGTTAIIQETILKTDTLLKHGRYHIALSSFTQLEPQTAYELVVNLDGQTAGLQPFKTFPQKDLFDFSFLTGSCAMRPPQALRMFYPGPQEAIYPVMEKMPGDFMLWLGDNVYYLLKHMNVPEQMYERRIRKAQVPEVNAFMRSRPMYSIWDDHDYGPDNAKGNFALKDTSWYIHTHFWANPFNGTPACKGTFSDFSLADADFFLTDNRFHSTTYKATSPAMLGKDQMNGLKENLLKSTATFHFIVIGSQALNTLDRGESWYRYRTERQDFLDFLLENQIKNVVFLTGDRHHTELQKVILGDDLVVHDFTCSPMTSVTNKGILGTPEENNPQRVPGTLLVDHNFGRVSLSGEAGSRQCLLEVFDPKGQLVWDYLIPEQH